MRSQEGFGIRAELLVAVFCKDRKTCRDPERIRGGKRERVARRIEVVFEGEGDYRQTDFRFLFGAGSCCVQDEGPVFQKRQVKLVTVRKEGFVRRGFEGKEELKDNRVRAEFAQFVCLNYGFQAAYQSRMKQVLFRECPGASQLVAALCVVDDFRLVEVCDVVALETQVVGSKLFVIQRIESGEQSLRVGPDAIRSLQGVVGFDRSNATELPKRLVVPWALRNTEEKEAEAPAGYREGPSQKMGKSPPEPGGALPDEFLEFVGPGHEVQDSVTAQTKPGRMILNSYPALALKLDMKRKKELQEQLLPSRAGS